MSIFAVVVGGFATLVLAIIFRAWVFTVLWTWFLVPFGLPALSITTALGISLIVGMFTSHLQEKKTKESSSVSELVGTIIAHAFGAPLVVLLMGWIVTWFM